MNPPATPLGLALPGNQIFQRYVASRSVRERELSMACLDEITTGFVTGIDEEWLQVAAAPEFRAKLIRQSAITSIGESGRSISDLNSHDRSRVHKYVELFRSIAVKETEQYKK